MLPFRGRVVTGDWRSGSRLLVQSDREFSARETLLEQGFETGIQIGFVNDVVEDKAAVLFLQEVDQAANQGVFGDAAVFGDRLAGDSNVLPDQVAAALGDLVFEFVEKSDLFVGQQEGDLGQLLVSGSAGRHFDPARALCSFGSGGHAGRVAELLELVN